MGYPRSQLVREIALVWRGKTVLLSVLKMYELSDGTKATVRNNGVSVLRVEFMVQYYS